MGRLVEIFMHRDKMTKREAIAQVKEMRDRVWDGEDPEEVLYEQGLEPDYVFDII